MRFLVALRAKSNYTSVFIDQPFSLFNYYWFCDQVKGG